MKAFSLQPSAFSGMVAGMLLALALAGRAATPPPWPPVEELLEVVRANLPAVDEERLRAGAVQGLLASLAPDVLPEAGAATNPPVARLRVYDGAFGYLRVGTVDAALPAELAAARAALARTNTLRGLVLDLRFAGGTDFAAVPAAAALFTGTNRPALRLAGETLEAPPGPTAVPPVLPVMLLVNHRTAGAAEALAAAVRANASRTLALGAVTAGQARDYRTVTLSTGARLRFAAEPVEVVGGPLLGAAGFRPDLAVAVDPDDERLWFADEYRALRHGQDVQLAPRRFSEADLVRLRRGSRPATPSGSDETAGPPAVLPTPGPVVQDPVLARALDLLAAAGEG